MEKAEELCKQRSQRKPGESGDVWAKETKWWAHLELLNTLPRKHSRALIRANCGHEEQRTTCSQQQTLHTENCYSWSEVCLFPSASQRTSVVSHDDRTKHSLQTAKVGKIFNAPLEHSVIRLLNWQDCFLIPNHLVNDKYAYGKY